MVRLRTLCEGAREIGVPLLLDAEQTHRQPAIRLLARTLASEYNASAAAPPLVYDTHQVRGHPAAAPYRATMLISDVDIDPPS